MMYDSNKVVFPLKSIAAIVAIATEIDCRCVYVAHENAIIKAWNGQLSAPYNISHIYL